MDLPASLSADGQPASVTLDRRPVGDDVEIRVEARLGSSRAGQLTRWARQGDAWTLVSAELGT
jgi:hypothetical protein